MKRLRYRVTLTFTDGDYTIDVITDSPDVAKQMALVDARSVETVPWRNGTLLATKAEPVWEMRVDAHCVDDEFEEMILKTYDVRISDRTGAPWDWGFRGTRGNLERMWDEHWGDAPERMPEMKEVQE